MVLLLILIIGNVIYLFNLALYHSIYGMVLQILTFISFISFLIASIIKKRNLTKKARNHHQRFFSEN